MTTARTPAELDQDLDGGWVDPTRRASDPRSAVAGECCVTELAGPFWHVAQRGPRCCTRVLEAPDLVRRRQAGRGACAVEINPRPLDEATAWIESRASSGPRRASRPSTSLLRAEDRSGLSSSESKGPPRRRRNLRHLARRPPLRRLRRAASSTPGSTSSLAGSVALRDRHWPDGPRGDRRAGGGPIQLHRLPRRRGRRARRRVPRDRLAPAACVHLRRAEMALAGDDPREHRHRPARPRVRAEPADPRGRAA